MSDLLLPTSPCPGETGGRTARHSALQHSLHVRLTPQDMAVSPQLCTAPCHTWKTAWLPCWMVQGLKGSLQAGGAPCTREGGGVGGGGCEVCDGGGGSGAPCTRKGWGKLDGLGEDLWQNVFSVGGPRTTTLKCHKCVKVAKVNKVTPKLHL